MWVRQTLPQDSELWALWVINHRPYRPKILSASLKTALKIGYRTFYANPVPAPVYGETGTGKEVVADMFESHLKENLPFVRINCGALSSSLMESELFGHKKGAFTGASADRAGLVESASGGWLFLDEVALLSDAAQKSLLRVIENQQIIRLGESKPRKVNVKVISATNEDLELKVRDGSFRADLWQRLREIDILLPPLRERVAEITELVEYFAITMEGGPYTLSPTTLEVLKKYNWSNGNVRELRNCLRAMTEFSTGSALLPSSIPISIFKSISKEIKTKPSDYFRLCVDVNLSRKVSLAEIEEKVFSSIVLEILQRNYINSLRKLEPYLDVSRITLAKRLRKMISDGSIDKSGIHKQLLESLEQNKNE